MIFTLSCIVGINWWSIYRLENDKENTQRGFWERLLDMPPTLLSLKKHQKRWDFQNNVSINRTTYASIYDHHHGDSSIELEMTVEEEDLCNRKMKSNEQILNGKWERCEQYDASLFKLERLWLRVAAVLTVFYNHLLRQLGEDKPEVTENISMAMISFIDLSLPEQGSKYDL